MKDTRLVSLAGSSFIVGRPVLCPNGPLRPVVLCRNSFLFLGSEKGLLALVDSLAILFEKSLQPIQPRHRRRR